MPITTPGKFALAAAAVAAVGVIVWQLAPKGGGKNATDASQPSLALDQINKGTPGAEAPSVNPAFAQAEQLSNAAIEADNEELLWQNLTKEQMLERAGVFEALASLREATGQAHTGRLRMQAAMLIIRAGGDLAQAEDLLMQALNDSSSVADVARAAQSVRRLARAYREAGQDDKATAVMAQAREAVVGAVEKFASNKMWQDEPAAFAQLATAARMSIYRGVGGPGGGGGPGAGWRGAGAGAGAGPGIFTLGGGGGQAGRGGGWGGNLDPNSDAGKALARLRDASLAVADQSTQPELAGLRVEANMSRARDASQAGDYETTKAFIERAALDRTPEQANNPVVQLQDLSLLARGMDAQEVSQSALAAYDRAANAENPMTRGISGMMTLSILRDANQGPTQARVARDYIAWLDTQAANPPQPGQFFGGQGFGGQGGGGGFQAEGRAGAGVGAGAGGGGFNPANAIQGMITRQRERALTLLVPEQGSTTPSTVPVADQVWALDELIANARDDAQAARWQERRDAIAPPQVNPNASSSGDK
jgi:tetratricopeptide (TPR) repeat protein